MRTHQSESHLRTWPQIRHNPPNKSEHIRKLTNLETGIRKELKHTKKRQRPRASSGDFYKTQETWEQNSVYKLTHNPHIDPDATRIKWLGDHTYTDAKRNKTNMDQCYAPNVANLSPTPASLEDVNTTPNYAHLDTIAPSSSYMNNWKNTMEADGQQSVWTSATKPSRTLRHKQK